MADIFISYRRADTQETAEKIYHYLQSMHNPPVVFMDRESTQVGEHFPKRLAEEIASCLLMVVIIGPTWVSITEENEPAKRRIDNPNDWVRKEVEGGLVRREPVVVPLLINGARMPTVVDLPLSIQPLSPLQALVLDDDPNLFHSQMQTLLEKLDRNRTLKRELDRIIQRKRQRVIGLGIAVWILVTLLLAVFLPSSTSAPVDLTIARLNGNACAAWQTQLHDQLSNENTSIYLLDTAIENESDARAYGESPQHPSHMIIWGGCDTEGANVTLHVELLREPILYQVLEPLTLILQPPTIKNAVQSIEPVVAYQQRNYPQADDAFFSILPDDAAYSGSVELKLLWANNFLFAGCYEDAIRHYTSLKKEQPLIVYNNRGFAWLQWSLEGILGSPQDISQSTVCSGSTRAQPHRQTALLDFEQFFQNSKDDFEAAQDEANSQKDMLVADIASANLGIAFAFHYAYPLGVEDDYETALSFCNQAGGDLTKTTRPIGLLCHAINDQDKILTLSESCDSLPALQAVLEKFTDDIITPLDDSILGQAAYVRSYMDYMYSANSDCSVDSNGKSKYATMYVNNYCSFEDWKERHHLLLPFLDNWVTTANTPNGVSQPIACPASQPSS